MKKDIFPIRPLDIDRQFIDSEADEVSKKTSFPIQIVVSQRVKKNCYPIQLSPGKLLRLNQFIPEIIPMSRSKWWEGVKNKIYPSPISLGPRTTAWRSDDLIALIENGV